MVKLTRYNLAIALVIALGGFTYGFGFGVFITSIGQPAFFNYFDLDPSSSHTASILGAVNALFSFGAFLGALIQGYTSDWLRSQEGYGFVRRRLPPPHRRGFLAGSTTMSFAIGYLVMLVGVVQGCLDLVGCYFAKNPTIQWRMPLALACVGPVVLLIGLLFVPESPRYYAWIGQKDKAWEVIQKIHHDATDLEDTAAHAELIQILRQVEHDKEAKTGFRVMFTTPSLRRRCFIAMYLHTIYWSFGNYQLHRPDYGKPRSHGVMPLILYVVFSSCANLAVLLAISIVDKVGRRKMLLVGFTGCAICLLIEALLQRSYFGTGNKSGLVACLFFIYLYEVVYQRVDATSFVYCAVNLLNHDPCQRA
ncbi:hypothetical protein LTR46_011295 [Exophiala xenobiotica]|nr:hypothetical protein LTR46_011295 [Exophiala xenobiotica]